MEAINHLNCSNLSSDNIEALKQAGVKSLMNVVTAPVAVVRDALDITEDEAHNFRQDVLAYLQPHPISLPQIALSEKSIPRSTGVPKLDKLLHGGLLAGEILDLYGKAGTGKSQLCFWITSHFCRNDSYVLYFDMKHDFSGKRFLELCNGNEQALERVILFREANFERLISRLEDIRNEYAGCISQVYTKTRLLVVDSVPTCIYPVVQEDIYSWRFHQENLLLKLQWLADHLNLSVVLVNHAVTTREKCANGDVPPKSANAAKVKSAMGKYWESKIALRIKLTKYEVTTFHEGIIEKSSRSPSGQHFVFSIHKDNLS